MSPGAIVWPGFLGGEARRREAVAGGQPVFVATPRALAGTSAAAAPLPALLLARLYRLGAAEPTHAEIRLPDGTVTWCDPAWITPRARLALLPERRTA